MSSGISKGLFIEVLSKIKEQENIDNEVSKALEKLSDSWILMNTKNKIYEALFKLLKETMNDKDDFIGWWLYEDVKKEVEVKGEKIEIITEGDLYDFLEKFYGVGKILKEKT